MKNSVEESPIAATLIDLIAFATLDVDPPEHHQLCRDHKLMNVPALAFYRDGSLNRTGTGLLAPEAFDRYLTELIR